MDKSQSNWIHIISTKVGDCKLAYFRSRKAGLTEDRKFGFGYFVLLYFTVFNNTSKMELKIPLRLLPFVRRKMKEFESGNKTSESLLIDDIRFSLVAWPDNENVQMNCYHAATDSNHLANLKMNDLKKLVMCLETLALLVKTQPERTETREQYVSYANDLISWAVARCAYKEVCKLLEPGRAIESVEQYVELWTKVEEDLSHFNCCVEVFLRKLTEQVPVQVQPMSGEEARKTADFTLYGYLYSRPEYDWQPIQFLVAILHSGSC